MASRVREAISRGGRLFARAPSCQSPHSAIGQFEVYQRARRTAQHLMTALRSAPNKTGRHGPGVKHVAAAATAIAGSVAALRGAFSLTRKVTIQEAAEDCEKLVRSVANTPFSAYWREGMYTMQFEPPYQGAPVMVVTHGFAAGSGMFCFNVDDLARNYHLYLVDWLGCGASERPKWTAKTVSEGERFFTDSLERWADASFGPGNGRFVLFGHSLGGYLSAAYTLRYPARVQHLLLVSPAGIPTPPDPAQLAQRQTGWIMSLLRTLWERGVTPQAMVRAMGPIGERLAGKLLTARFRHVLAREGVSIEQQAAGKPPSGTTGAGAPSSHDATLEEAAAAASVPGAGFDFEAFKRYLYGITAADASGEMALHVLLAFGAHARQPMGPRLIEAARVGERREEDIAAGRPGPLHKLRAPVTFAYGQHDWMDINAGLAAVEALRAAGVDAEAFITPQSGHHLYMEQPEVFDAQVLGRLKRSGGLR